MLVLFGGNNLPPLVEIGLTDLPKFGCHGTPRDDRPGVMGPYKSGDKKTVRREGIEHIKRVMLMFSSH